ncbi:MAG TPA: condensation domain-containing protein, partial [Albitalea sp.]|nr:condensation domain-containing protein [Albitalea sp.]
MKRDPEASAPLSVMQQRIWFMEAMLEGHCTYNLCSARKLTGPLNVAALERAINALIERHGALRTMIRGTDSQAAEQVVLTHRAFHLPPAEDLSLLSEPDRQLRLDSRLADIAREPISLHGGPLFECMLFRLAQEEHLLLFKIHHIVFDGWSMGVVLRDLGQLYALHCAGTPADLPPLPISYAEFAAWHNEWLSSEPVQQHIRYWTERLKSLGEPLALPSDHPRPRHPSNDAGSVSFAIDHATTERLRALAHAQEASVFGAALAAYLVFLH